MIQYAKRANAFEKGEQDWTVSPEALIWSRPGAGTASLPWREVVEVRLAFAPTRLKPARYLLSLTARGGRRWTVDNQHFAGIANFEDRSARFTPFVLGCVERVAALAPGARARLGASAGSYWAQLVFVTAMFALLVAILILLPTPLGAVVWIKAVIVIASLPLLARWVRRARPRRVSLDARTFRAALP